MSKSLVVGIFGAKTYPPKIGGIETHIYYLSSELKKRYVKFLVFVGKNKFSNTYEKLDENIEIFRVYQSKNRYLLKISMIVPILFKLRKLKNKIKIYHAHDSVFGFVMSILGHRPLVYTAHGCAFLRSDWPFWIRHILKFMEIVTFKKADAVICVDYNTKQVVERYRKKNIFIVPNGVDPEKFNDLPRPSEYNPDKTIIFSAGRLIPSKGFQDLIQAYKMLDEYVKNKVELFIAGTGPYIDQLKNMAKDEPRIHILGYVPEIEPYFAYADIFVLPSHYEGFPFTLLEAMAAKTACIATDVGDIKRRFTDNRELIIVPPQDVEKLNEQLRRLIKNKKLSLEMAANAKERIKKEYTWKAISNEILHIYKKVTHQKQ